MPKMEYWTSLPVEIFLDLDDEDTTDAAAAAFELAAEDLESARDEIESEIQDFIGKRQAAKLRIGNVEFVEFDSGNISHAGAHYKGEIAGPKEVLTALKKVLKKEGLME